DRQSMLLDLNVELIRHRDASLNRGPVVPAPAGRVTASLHHARRQRDGRQSRLTAHGMPGEIDGLGLRVHVQLCSHGLDTQLKPATSAPKLTEARVADDQCTIRVLTAIVLFEQLLTPEDAPLVVGGSEGSIGQPGEYAEVLVFEPLPAEQ